MIQKGDVFTRLKVIEENVSPPKDKEYAKNIGKWHKCVCSCKDQTIVVVPEMSLVNHSTKSCGCLKAEKARIQIELNRKQMKKNGNSTIPKSKVTNLKYNGETKSLTEWAKYIGISKQALSRHLKKRSLEEVLSMKGRRKNGN